SPGDGGSSRRPGPGTGGRGVQTRVDRPAWPAPQVRRRSHPDPAMGARLLGIRSAASSPCELLRAVSNAFTSKDGDPGEVLQGMRNGASGSWEGEGDGHARSRSRDQPGLWARVLMVPGAVVIPV